MKLFNLKDSGRNVCRILRWEQKKNIATACVTVEICWYICLELKEFLADDLWWRQKKICLSWRGDSLFLL
jgi:hypothetical protein